MSRVLPILFNTEMAAAILDERKTATRRLIKFPENNFTGEVPQADNIKVCKNTLFAKKISFLEEPHYSFDMSPPCHLGDILYVRETWKCWRAHRYEATADIMYKAGGEGIRVLFANDSTDSAGRYDYDRFISKWFGQKWCQSIHMPKEVARIWLKVTDVRPERLQDITHVDIITEGIKPEYIDANSGEKTRNDFSQLWNSTIKKSDINLYGWDANPWVWVIEFERCEKPEGWCV